MGLGRCSGNCTPPTCKSPPIIPFASLVSGCTGLFALLSPTLSPQAFPCPQRALTTNDPKTILKLYWYHFGIIWYRFGIVLVSFCYHRPPHLVLHLRTLQARPLPLLFLGRAPRPPPANPKQPRPLLPNTQSLGPPPPSTRKRMKQVPLSILAF